MRSTLATLTLIEHQDRENLVLLHDLLADKNEDGRPCGSESQGDRGRGTAARHPKIYGESFESVAGLRASCPPLIFFFIVIGADRATVVPNSPGTRGAEGRRIDLRLGSTLQRDRATGCVLVFLGQPECDIPTIGSLGDCCMLFLFLEDWEFRLGL